MQTDQQPKNENLRLVLSVDQEKWLRQQIRISKNLAWAMVALLIVSASWLSLNFANVVAWSDGPECFILEGAAATDQEMRNEFVAQGLKPCPPEKAQEKGLSSGDVLAGVTLLSALLILVSGLGLMRNLYQLKKYKNYLLDHRAFLEKYNRL